MNEEQRIEELWKKILDGEENTINSDKKEDLTKESILIQAIQEKGREQTRQNIHSALNTPQKNTTKTRILYPLMAIAATLLLTPGKTSTSIKYS